MEASGLTRCRKPKYFFIGNYKDMLFSSELEIAIYFRIGPRRLRKETDQRHNIPW